MLVPAKSNRRCISPAAGTIATRFCLVFVVTVVVIVVTVVIVFVIVVAIVVFRC